MRTQTSARLMQAACVLRRAVDSLRFGPPVTHVYNPLTYAWAAHARYLRRWGDGPKRVLFLGLNPGPFGMVQTGVPFGEVTAVRDWLGVAAPIGQPPRLHPKRPVVGFGCPRSEVSGRRLWGLFATRFGTAERFFADHFVVNYCPLAFFDAAGRNVTPDKLPAASRAELLAVCDEHLRQVVAILRPRWVVGVGNFASQRAAGVLAGQGVEVAKLPHPSPANPAANRDWAGRVRAELERLGIWTRR